MYAENDFQLIEARTRHGRAEIPWRRSNSFVNPNVLFDDETVNRTSSSDHITAIIGKNGTGKSYLLTSIVQTFLALEDAQTMRKDNVGSIPLEYLAYRADGKTCVVSRRRRGKLELQVEGREVSIFHLPLPRRVVALTVTPFDKFPVPTKIRGSSTQNEAFLYEYLGLRDRFNKASLENLLYRSLNNLFDEARDDALRRVNVEAAFSYFELRPRLTVAYRLKIPKIIRDAIVHQKTLRYPQIGNDYSQRRRVEQMLTDGLDINYLNDLLVRAIANAQYGIIRTTADFAPGGRIDEAFKDLQPLRRAGFLSVEGIEVIQYNGVVADLKRASSGQLSMIVSLLSLASVITNASLVLIDEPELSLHPEWQTEYVNLLVRTFSRFDGCHFVVATHSPMVISELPAHARIVALDRPNIPSVAESAGQSADYLLAEVFGAPSRGNLHVRQLIVEALKLVANGKARTQAFRDTLSNLTEVAKELDPSDPAAEVIANLAEVAKDAGTKVQK
ncbi:AAA family ATPase [Rhizobium leguminosarum]|uniref:AAA family ATPase n=1 Tax=Rhizobium leguminosarum TaxID=384 RepID=UPI0013BFDB8A|nr:AAA family ATPase [Rhizobium leguminosarum]NEH54838.1 AAA family ATPase [Rhizobium leguminosarum]